MVVFHQYVFLVGRFHGTKDPFNDHVVKCIVAILRSYVFGVPGFAYFLSCFLDQVEIS